ncbi:Uncharacterized conserved protein, DUF849 family [Faunimonas pinastri]|uniref:Uncharacterized conserved protein, DUF849 family n=1 Tax=Faunimonas pinastri TaxID=1855383 RepID=A0A1H9FUS2_9HYPH|nr:3-keto-5-aminohexanoate cleavage protein [Faunimonas pinastri]SEQ41549.1 Uncharacterized conserved protein, DUF849 family [Faunimonas pinastri]
MLQACLNGGRDRRFSPAVPFTPAELAADALAVRTAGATELHVHPRDGAGRESLLATDVSAALHAIRAAVPGMPVGLSTGDWIAPTGTPRLDAIREWQALPDYLSVNLGEADAADMIGLVTSRGIGVEAGLATPQDARRLVDLGKGPDCLRILLEIEEADSAEARRVADEMIAILEAAKIGVPRLLHGFDDNIWAMCRRARELGLDTRIGLEDGRHLPSGAPARSNAELAAAAVGIAA